MGFCQGAISVVTQIRIPFRVPFKRHLQRFLKDFYRGAIRVVL